MKKPLRALVLVLLVLAVVYLAWYFFVDSLRLSEIMPPSENFIVTAAVSLIDFDTGLTRYDLYRLSNFVEEYEPRMREVENIHSHLRRQQAEQELMNEMLQDPTFRKIFTGVGQFLGKAGIKAFDFLLKIAKL